MQWPNPHIPLGTQVQLRECGQRFPRAQSTGGSGAGGGGGGGRSVISIFSPHHPLQPEGWREARMDLNLNWT